MFPIRTWVSRSFPSFSLLCDVKVRFFVPLLRDCIAPSHSLLGFALTYFVVNPVLAYQDVYPPKDVANMYDPYELVIDPQRQVLYAISAYLPSSSPLLFFPSTCSRY